MLCDHGCDNIGSIIIPIIVTRIYQIGSGLPIMLVMVVGTFPPYHLLMQEYYIGSLDMPPLIDPDNTSLQVSVVCFITAFFGSVDFWNTQIPLPYDYKVPLSGIGVLFMAIFEIVTVFGIVVPTLWRARNTAYFKKKFRWPYFLMHTSYAIILLTIYFSYITLTPTQIHYTNPRLYQLAYGLQLLQAVLRLLLANVTQELFVPIRRTTILCWSLIGVNFFSMVFSEDQ